jgi:hypothetical protein
MNPLESTLQFCWALVALFAITCPVSAFQPPVELDANLIAHYPLDGTGQDKSVSKADGVVVGATPTLDRFGNTNAAMHFNGTSDHIEIPEVSSSDISRISAWTISAWIRPTTLSNSDWPTIYSEGFFVASLGVVSGNDGRLYSDINNGNPVYSPASLDLSRWTHVAVTYNGTVRQLFIDGQLVQSGPAPAVNDDNTGATIGISGADGRTYFSGDVDDVRIFNKALAAEEVAAVFKLENPGPVVTIEPRFQIVPVGGTVHISSTSLRSEPLSYQWLRNGIPLTGETAPDLVIESARSSDSADYSLRVSNNLLGTTTKASKLHVGIPIEAFQGTEVRFPSQLGKSYQILVSTSVVDAPWILPPSSKLTPGTGKLMGQFLSGRESSALFIRSMETNGEPPIIESGAIPGGTGALEIHGPESQNVPLGGRGAFAVTVSGGAAPYHYQWLRDGAVMQGETQPILEFPSARKSDISTRYSVRVTDATETKESQQASLDVGPFQVAVTIAIELEFPCDPGKKYRLYGSNDGDNWNLLPGQQAIPCGGAKITRIIGDQDAPYEFFKPEEEL